jgi:hypothetical protein
MSLVAGTDVMVVGFEFAVEDVPELVASELLEIVRADVVAENVGVDALYEADDTADDSVLC